MSKTALIVGVSGQDGAYLAAHLLQLGYAVHGTSRDAAMQSFGNLKRLGIHDQLTIHSMTVTDFRSVLQTLSQVAPDEVYNIGGQSSVGLSFAQPVETFDSVAKGTLNLLESIRFMDKPVRFYNASSTECFGDTGAERANEQSPLRPRSPYAVAKATAFWTVQNYRQAYGIFCCSGILSNHESPLRAERFVTQKIVAGACRIAKGEQDKLDLGNLEVARDWGWAPDYVDVMHRMLQQDDPGDYVVGTGATHRLQDFVDVAFRENGLNWRDHVIQDTELLRPLDVPYSAVDPSRAERELGWTATKFMPEVVVAMVEAYHDRHGGASPK